MPYVFDAYGTLFDVHAAIGRHRAAAGPDADRFSDLWRIKQLEYTWTHTLAGRYADFWTADPARARLTASTRFPSVDRIAPCRPARRLPQARRLPRRAQGAARALKARGDTTAILSNGSPAMLTSAVEAAGLKADARRRAVGRHAEDVQAAPGGLCAGDTAQFACKPAEVVFVSSNRWDAMGATAFGFRTVWINRAGGARRIHRLPAGRGGVRSDRRAVGPADPSISGSRPCRRRAGPRPTRSRISSSRRA